MLIQQISLGPCSTCLGRCLEFMPRFKKVRRQRSAELVNLTPATTMTGVVAEVVAVLAVEAVAEDVMVAVVVAAVVAAMVVVAEEAVMVAEVAEDNNKFILVMWMSLIPHAPLLMMSMLSCSKVAIGLLFWRCEMPKTGTTMES